METEDAVKFELSSEPLAHGIVATSTPEEDAQYLRVTLDKAENMRVAIAIRLREVLTNRCGGDVEKLRRWYESTVWEGKPHRAWEKILPDLPAIKNEKKYPNLDETINDRIRRTRVKINRYAAKKRMHTKNESHASSVHVHEDDTDHQLEELVMIFNDMPRKLQDEFLMRIGARRVAEAA